MTETLQMSSSNDHVFTPASQASISDLPRMNSSTLKTFPEEAVLSFHNVSYREQEKRGFLCHQEISKREVLSEINGIIECGLNAIVGPCGADRSLLLDILAARKDPRGLSGDILINGVPQTAKFKYNSGYVPQNDAVMYTVTVRENLAFTAALRLPTTMRNEDKRCRVNEVIHLLGLKKMADSKARSKEVRRRTSIAMELISDHPFLFLDEPTMGLDWSAANDVMRLLKRVSHLGRTIIFSIHQPQYSIFRLFDSLTLLASGKLIFHGPAQEALQHFESIGYSNEPHNNPTDFFLEVIYRHSSGATLYGEGEDPEPNKSTKPVKSENQVPTLAELYAKSSFCRKTAAKLAKLSEGQKEKSVSAFTENAPYVTSSWHQLRWIIWRSFKNYLGFPRISGIQSTITLGLGIIISVIFQRLRNDCNAAETRTGLLFLLTIFQCMTSVSAGELFVIDKKFFLREHISGYYKITPYFFGKLISEFLPRRLLPSVIFTVVVYSIAGITTGMKSFFGTIFTILMLAYSASSVPLSIGAGEIATAIPTVLVRIYFVYMLAVEGILMLLVSYGPETSWLQLLSIPHYGFTALLHNEFSGQNFCLDVNATHRSTCQDYVICTGEEFLTMQGIDPSPWGFWKNHVILACTMTALLFITYLQLFFLKEETIFKFFFKLLRNTLTLQSSSLSHRIQ